MLCPEMGLYADGGITFTKVASVNASSPAVLQEGIHPVREMLSSGSIALPCLEALLGT